MVLVAGNGYRCIPGFVFDGDTLNMSFQGEQFKCRLQWIDCPEAQKTGKTSTDPLILKHWEWADRAKVALSNLVVGRDIIAIPSGKDMYDRWLCDLYIGTIKAANSVQIQLAKLGMCTTFFPYDRFNFSTRELVIYRGILTETAIANRKKVGIWSVSDFILPHEFKKLSF
jgi:endonuclease YncB( thermonuclease family)